jgi:hypothetical protein
MGPHAAYVYCLVRAAARPSLARVPAGVPHASAPEALPVSRGLWVVVSDVPLSIYGPEPLAGSLRDLDWVSQVALSHEAVIEHFIRGRAATVVPMKLFTMFSTRERAVADVRDRRQALAGILRRIAVADEWGVRVSLAAGSAGGRRTAPRPAGGAAFLAAKKHARDEARAAAVSALQVADASFAALQRIARDATRRDDAPAADVAPPLLDAAFLVPRAKTLAFKAAAGRPRPTAGARGPA